MIKVKGNIWTMYYCWTCSWQNSILKNRINFKNKKKNQTTS